MRSHDDEVRLLPRVTWTKTSIAIGVCDTVPLSALRLISVALTKGQVGRYAVSNPSSVIPEYLLRRQGGVRKEAA